MRRAHSKKLTNIQREALELLFDGEIIKIDRNDIASIGTRHFSPATRFFLTDMNYVKKKIEHWSLQDGPCFIA